MQVASVSLGLPRPFEQKPDTAKRITQASSLHETRNTTSLQRAGTASPNQLQHYRRGKKRFCCKLQNINSTFSTSDHQKTTLLAGSSVRAGTSLLQSRNDEGAAKKKILKGSQSACFITKILKRAQKKAGKLNTFLETSGAL